MYSCMVGSYAASTMPTTMVRTTYRTQTVLLRTEDRLALCKRQIDPEKRPGRPGDDASPLGRARHHLTCKFDRSGCHAGGEPRAGS
jgi:hypothetical protein